MKLGATLAISLTLGVFTNLGYVQSQSFVDPFIPLSEFEGWGTSLTWWPDVLGAMPEDVIEHVTKAFFTSEGLNLNIVRYTIGGTTPGNYTCGGYRDGGATESYKDGPDKPYDWTRDARQRKILGIAKDLGVDTFEAFSNSPPQWMTISGCSKGNAQGGVIHSNFDPVRSGEFAEYISDVLEHFESTWGIHFQTFAPFNEPFGLRGLGGWNGPTQNQEGCNMNQATMTEVIRVLHQVFQERGIKIELSVADETQTDTAVMSQEFFRNQGIASLIGKVNVHGYWDIPSARRDTLYSNSVKDGHRLWMDEMGWAGSPVSDMSQGLNIATRVVKDLNVMLASAWVYWQALEDIGAWGLLSIPFKDPSVPNIVYNSGYYAFLQFTKYIRKGFLIMSVSDENTVAAYDPVAQSLVLAIVNPTKEPEPHQYNFNLFTSLTGTPTATRTSSTEQHKALSSSELKFSNKTLSYTSPAESVTTIVLPGVTLGSVQGNLIQDGGFELTGASSPWELAGAAVLTSTNTWLGSQSGLVSKEGGRLRQTFVAKRTGSVFITAKCSTTNTQNGVSLFAFNNNQPGKIAQVGVQGKVYVSYGLVLGVNAGDEVTISFESVSGDSYIDSVTVHEGL